jgi:hypothetical protein
VTADEESLGRVARGHLALSRMRKRTSRRRYRDSKFCQIHISAFYGISEPCEAKNLENVLLRFVGQINLE